MITRKVNNSENNNNNNNNKSEKKSVGRKRVKKKEVVVSKTGIEVSECYCRKCREMKPVSSFLSATDTVLDTNGYMSVCKDCIGDLYVRIFQTEHTIERAILRMCRILNIRYSEEAVASVQKQLATNNKTPDSPSIMGIYKSKLMATQKTEVGKRDLSEDFTFVEPRGIAIPSEPLPDSMPDKDYLEKAWGKGLSFEDYAFLEEQFANFKQTHKADTYSEIILLREVCWKLLNISKARFEGTSVDSDVESLQKIMKSLAISPNMANVANSGKNLETLGLWIADIEREEPAQWLEHEGHEMYRDVGNVEEYFQKYFVRPLRNAILQSKEFNIDDEDMENYEDYDDMLKELEDGNESTPISK